MRNISLRQGIKIDGQKCDRAALRGGERRAQRRLVSDRHKYVYLARCELAIACIVTIDIRCLDIFEHEVPALLIAKFGHPHQEGCINRKLSGLNTDKPDTQHFGLLPPRRDRPRRRRAAEQRDELPPGAHSITSSARASSDSGIVRPSALAVVSLMTSSNLAGCSTGKSPGFAPRRILST